MNRFDHCYDNSTYGHNLHFQVSIMCPYTGIFATRINVTINNKNPSFGTVQIEKKTQNNIGKIDTLNPDIHGRSLS